MLKLKYFEIYGQNEMYFNTYAAPRVREIP